MTKCNHDYCYHEYVGMAGVKCLKCENKRLTQQLAAAEAELSTVVDLIDDVLFDPMFHPHDEYGEEIRGNRKYLVPHKIQEQHMPALRGWFVQQCERASEGGGA
jgi:hypothetical protein